MARTIGDTNRRTWTTFASRPSLSGADTKPRMGGRVVSGVSATSDANPTQVCQAALRMDMRTDQLG